MSTLRSAWRSLIRSRSLSLAAALCIALGAAATMAVVTLADAVLLRPVPFPQADRLVRVWLDERGVDPRVSFSIPESRELRALPAFDTAIATARVRALAVAGDRAERLRGEGVDGGYFDLLGVRPAAGRLLDARDHLPGAAPAVVLGYGFWMRALGASPAAIGGVLKTQRATYTIVGVAPRWFTGTVEDDVVEFWIPIERYEPRQMLTDADARQTWMVARLAPGSDLAAAGAQAAALAGAWKERDPRRYRNHGLRVEAFGENWRRGLRGGTAMLVVAAASLLAIAALNVGCLLLARVIDRRRELAVRTALGATRGRLLAQLIAEALILSVAGGALGMAAGPAALTALLGLSPVALPGYLVVAPDIRVALASVAALVLAALAAGTLPAMVGAGADVAPALASNSRGTTAAPGERRSVTLLIAAETALTLVLLVTGGLLLRSYDRLSSLDLGYRREGIARLAVTLSAADAGPAAARNTVYERLRAAVAAVPGVESIGLVTPTLPPWDADRSRLRFGGLDPRSADAGVPVGLHIADPGLLPTLGIPLIAGRAFNQAEPAAVAIVSRSVANRLGGIDGALGRWIEFPDDPALMSTVSGRFIVVGVAENVAWDGLVEQDTRRLIRFGSGDPRGERWDVYVPLSRTAQTIVSIAASTRGSAAALIEPIRRAIGTVAPASAVHWTGTMEADVALEYAPARFYAVLVAAFSGSAMLLTGAGLFGLLWNASARRTGEVGLRLALGASRRSVAWLAVTSAIRPLVAGAILGLFGAAVSAKSVSALLYDVAPIDPLSFAAALGLLAAVSAVAAWLPARRAARVDPLVALRLE